ncbi:MAG TPA: UDP-N-acetylglucosamine 1-carboxyvinyltransferase, partial [Actinomycetota bacterium]|nr:UDP-N-acetylglucosamine 1-carboxyvinyltransferase [Actinomycetota bacterium]
PEIIDLVGFLRSMGARISGEGTSVVEVEGVEELRPGSQEVMPDRLEAGTYMFAAAAAGGDVTVDGVVAEHLDMVCEKLVDCGMEVDGGPDWVRVRSEGRPRPADVSTLPYPGFPTDLQPLMVAVLTRARGLSIVTENIFDGRFMYIDELARMGADVRTEGHYIVIRGVERLTGAPVVASDLRAGAALVVAALAAEGWTSVENIAQIDRGYERFEERLSSLGARIRRAPAGDLVEA